VLAQDRDDLYVEGHYKKYPQFLQAVQTIHSYRSYGVVLSIVVATRLAQCGLESLNVELTCYMRILTYGMHVITHNHFLVHHKYIASKY
jgi:hypothetical protein